MFDLVAFIIIPKPHNYQMAGVGQAGHLLGGEGTQNHRRGSGLGKGIEERVREPDRMWGNDLRLWTRCVRNVPRHGTRV